MRNARTITVVTAAVLAIPAAAAFNAARPAQDVPVPVPLEPTYTTQDARAAGQQARAAAYRAGVAPRAAVVATRTVRRVAATSIARIAVAKEKALVKLYSPRWAQQWAKRYMAEHYGWTGAEYQALLGLWQRESEWDFRAENPSSGAYGIPQSLPASKMGSVAPDWRTNPRTQIRWGLKYIKSTYGSPSAAKAHSDASNWY